MRTLTQDEQVRAYVIGILVSYSGELLSPDNIVKIADELVEAVYDALEHHQSEKEDKIAYVLLNKEVNNG